MKFKVYKKWASSLLPATIFINLGGLFIIIVAALDKQKEATIAMSLALVGLITFNGLMFNIYKTLVSSVIFEKDAIRCSFLKRTRRLIAFKEIRDYGIFWERSTKFIFISKVKLSEVERNKKAFELYKKTKNVIVLEYNDEVMSFLKEHIVL